MFSADDFPRAQFQFQTRQALLILGLQNDFIARDGKLPVSAPAGLLDRIRKLVPVFRHAGDIIWVRSEFEVERTVNDPEGLAESVITDDEVPPEARRPAATVDLAVPGIDFRFEASSRISRLLERVAARAEVWEGPTATNTNDDAAAAADDDQRSRSETPDETFLSASSGPTDAPATRCCLPGTVGADFVDDARALIDPSVDSTVLTSHYSAFNSTDLISLLRGGLVTELFICGVLSNITVYATALDAVRHGYSVTLLEDCLGYRCRARHEEAIRQMREYMGADVMTSAELVEDLRSFDDGAERDGAAAPTASVEGVVPNTKLQPMPDRAETWPDRLPAPSTDSAISMTERRSSDPSSAAAPHDGKPDPARDARATDHGADGRSAPSATPPVDPTGPGPQPPSTPFMASPITVETAVAQVVKPVGRERVHRTHVRGPSIPNRGPGDDIGAGDSRIIHDLLPAPLKDDVFRRLREEIHFQTMYHRGGEVPRLVAVQAQVAEDGAVPIYRHPADESPPVAPFSPTVLAIKAAVERELRHPLNHVLIQYYRDGQDHISEHSDKSLDIVRHSSIANVSLGAQRTMTLRSKKSAADDDARDARKVKRGAGDPAVPSASSPARRTQRIPMPHNSLFVLGPATNMKWLHGIRPDKRPTPEKLAAESAQDGERISLTFRHIGTFLHPPSSTIWGQGARSKEREHAGRVVRGGTPEAEQMVIAFGRENQESEFDWEAVYGSGFDALEIVAIPPRLYLCGHRLADLRVQLHLAESGLKYQARKPHSVDSGARFQSERLHNVNVRPRFVDNDVDRTEVIGSLAIMFYIETYYLHHGAYGSSGSRPAIATSLSQFGESQELLMTWQRFCQRTTIFRKHKDAPASHASDRLKAEKALHRDLQMWEENVARFKSFVAGTSYTMADSAFWPVLDEIISKWADWDDEAFPELRKYHRRILGRANVGRLLLAEDEDDDDDDDDDNAESVGVKDLVGRHRLTDREEAVKVKDEEDHDDDDDDGIT